MKWWVVPGVMLGIGIALDRLMLRRQKIEWQDRLLRAWDWLDETPVTHFPARVAELGHGALRMRGSSTGKTVLRVSLMVIASVALSHLFWFVAHRAHEGLDFAGLLSFAHYTTVATNIPFDLLTVGVTSLVLGLVADRDRRGALLAMLGDVVLAALIGFVSLVAMIYIHVNVAYSLPFPPGHLGSESHQLLDDHVLASKDLVVTGNPMEVLRDDDELVRMAKRHGRIVRADSPSGLTLSEAAGLAWESLALLFRGADPSALGSVRKVATLTFADGHTHEFRVVLTATSRLVVLAGTTFVPSALVIAVLALCFAARGTLAASRRAAMFWLEKVTEPGGDAAGQRPQEFMPFTMAATALGVLWLSAVALAGVLAAT